MIFLLEDDSSIRFFVTYALKQSGFCVQSFEFPCDFWRALDEADEQPELLLLDIMLPQEDGLSILAKLRADTATRNLPVILLTARGTEYDKVIGFNCGADDYVSKPFGTMELIARIKAVLRRANSDTTKKTDEYTFGALFVCPSKHTVRVDNEDISLTLKEFELICMFIKQPETVFTRENILADIWHYDFEGESRTIDVHIRTLRSKLKKCGEYIETVRGVGYRLTLNCQSSHQ